MNDVWVSITKWTFFEKKKILQEIGTSKIKSSGMKVVQKQMFANTGYCREKKCKS